MSDFILSRVSQTLANEHSLETLVDSCLRGWSWLPEWNLPT